MITEEKVILLPAEKEIDNLIEFFTYVYEFNETMEFENSLSDFRAFLEDEIKELIKESPSLKELDKDKRWMLYHLLFLKEEANLNDFEFLYKTSYQLIRDIESINIEDLFFYVTLLNDALNYRGGNGLAIRPKERYKVLINSDINRKELPILYKLHYGIMDIANILKKDLRIKDYTDNLINVKYYKEKYKEYITIHERFAEHFMTYVYFKSSLSEYPFILPNKLDEELIENIEKASCKYIKGITNINDDKVKLISSKCAKIIISMLKDDK